MTADNERGQGGSDNEPNSSNSSRKTSSSIRQRLGSYMVDATDWAEEHRRELVFGSLTAAACGVGLLLHVHGIPGFTRITSNAELAARLLSLQQRRPHSHLTLAVLLSDAIVQDGHLLFKAIHYPALLRWYHRCKGISAAQLLQQTPTSPATPASSHDQPYNIGNPESTREATEAAASGHLSCWLAGVQNVQPQVQQLLKQYAAGNAIKVHKLRVFAVTQQSSLQNSKSRKVDLHLDADSSGAIFYARQQQQQLDAFARSASHSTVPAPRPGQEQSRPTTATAADPTDNYRQQQAAQGTSVTAATSAKLPSKIALAAAEAWKGCDAKQTQPVALHVWAELWVKGLPAKQLKQLAAAVAVGSATEKAAAAPGTYSSSSTVWWLISRRKDVASQLLQTGLAEVVPYEDFEWLGYRNAAIRAYSRASEHAQRKQLGIHAAAKSSAPPSAAAWRRFVQQILDIPGRFPQSLRARTK